MILLFAFGFRVLSSKYSIPGSLTFTSTISPTFLLFNFKSAFFPVVVAIETTAGKLLVLLPGFTILTEWIPPISFLELVE